MYTANNPRRSQSAISFFLSSQDHRVTERLVMNGSSSNPPSARASPTLQGGDSKENSSDGSTAIFRREDFLFMDEFYKIVNMLDGSNQEEIGIAVAKMDERFERARKILQEIPGLQYNKEEQEAILQREMDVLETKQQHLKQYMELPPFQALPEQP